MGAVLNAGKKVVKNIRKIGEKIGLAGLPKAVKNIAKKVKKAGADVWKGLQKNVFKPISNAIAPIMNKLGPIGSIALSFVLPGLGTMLGSLWTAASAYLPTAFVSAVNTGIAWAGKAMTFVKELPGKALSKLGESALGQTVKAGYGAVTDKITSAFEYVGGSVSDGASNMWQSAKEFLGMPAKPGVDAGAAIGQGAEKAMVDKAIAANPEFLKMANVQGGTVADFAREQSTFMAGQDAAAYQAGVDGLQANPEFVKMSNHKIDQYNSQQFALENPELANKGVTGLSSKTSGITGNSLAQEQYNYIKTTDVQSAEEFAGNKEGPSYLDKVKNALPKFDLGGASAIPQALPYIAPPMGDINNTDTNRFGVGGQGSAGGQFVDPTILAMIQAQSRQLEAQG